MRNSSRLNSARKSQNTQRSLQKSSSSFENLKRKSSRIRLRRSQPDIKSKKQSRLSGEAIDEVLSISQFQHEPIHVLELEHQIISEQNP